MPSGQDTGMIGLRRYLTYWGKAQPYWVWTQTWHPAAYHCLDVAAVAERALGGRPELLVRTARRLCIPWDDFAAGVTWLMALHDLGKFTEAFQWPFPAAYTGRGNPCREMRGGKPHHTHLFQAMARDGQGPLDPETWPMFAGWKKREILGVLRPISGHHGQPPLESVGGVVVDKGVDAADLKDGRRFLSFDARTDIGEYLEDLRRLILPGAWPRLDADGRAVLGLALSGFAVQCDWLGSSKERFPYEPPRLSLKSYWHDVARPRAASAVAEALPPRTPFSASTGLGGVFPGIAASPRPMQAAADALGIPDGPCLVVIEDVTGSGKTEASLVLAHRMANAGKGDGIFLGLPTMATSDAMYTRVTAAASTMYPTGSAPEIVLSHGGSTRKRRASLDARIAPDGPDGSVADYVESWLSSDKRTALIADLGVGTVDQALLAVLPARYQGLRLFGLAGKVLVLDEVHSYDAFMFEEIKALLKFHAFLGGSAIVMSATLSMADRQALAEAFRSGLPREIRPMPGDRVSGDAGMRALGAMSDAYPAIHVVSEAGLRSEAVDAYEGLRRRVSVEIARSWERADSLVAACLDGGGCACVVRSTVDEAIETHDRLAAAGHAPVLLHARFVPADRAAIQDEVLDRFGPDAPWEGRAGGLVVATQVVEQSLDLDFDLLVTDIAPVELIVQRAGRVARHVEARRSLGLPYDVASLVMVSPDPDDVRGPDWLDGVVKGAGIVYPDHGRLWATASAMKRQGGFLVPGDVRAIVEECTLAQGMPGDCSGRPTRRKASGRRWPAWGAWRFSIPGTGMRRPANGPTTPRRRPGSGRCAGR